MISIFDDRLKKLRIARGISQSQLAEELGMPQKTYCNYERNEREPSSTTLIKIASYFGVTLDYLLDYHIDNLVFSKEKNVHIESVDELKNRLLNNYDKMNKNAQNTLVKYSDFIVQQPENLKNNNQNNKINA